jgi:thioredoxin reductase (NADPH)
VEQFLGAGVFYGAAGSEAEALRGQDVHLIGGGNSAGQAALHLARQAASVTILIRGRTLAASMSDYLISELDATDNVTIRATTEVVAGSGDTRLEQLVLRDKGPGKEETVDTAGLFVMIGGIPFTDWLPSQVERDHGYIVTGRDTTSFPLDRAPFFLETTLPGVFAVGDARHGATRRVAPSVGSGAIAISLVHQYLNGGN